MGVLRSKTIILACTVAGALLGVAAALTTPKLYSATTELLIYPQDLKILDSDLAQGGISSDTALAMVENQVRIIMSGRVLNSVVERLDLANDPEFNGTASDGGLPNPLNMLRSLLAGAGSGDDAAFARVTAVNNLADNLFVGRDGKTFVVTITADARSPDKAAAIATVVTETYLQTSGELQASTVGRATDELTARLDELRRSVEDAERRVETFKAENDIIDAQGRLITDDEIVKLNDQLSVARARTAELKARAASTRSVDIDAVIDGVLPEQVNSGVMGELRSQYASLRQEADRLAVRLGPRHPQRQAVEAQLLGARDQIENELSRIRSSVQVELSRAEGLESDLSGQLDGLKARQGDLSGGLVTLRQLEREATSNRAVYEAFLLRARETGEQQNINTANINVISPATAPLKPSSLSRSSIAMSGMVMGLLAGVGLGLLRGVADSFRGNAPIGAAQRRRDAGEAKSAAVIPIPAMPSPQPDTMAAVVPPEIVSPAVETPEPMAETSPERAETPDPRPDKHARETAAPVPPLASYPISSARAEAGSFSMRADEIAAPRRQAIEDIRESLREFRDAVRDLNQSRKPSDV